MDYGLDSVYRRAFERREYHGYKWYLMALVAWVLLTLCFLFSGLTLGVCGLDIKWLELRFLTGTPKQRKQALAILRLKRNGSWMLCSLVICSVACGEYFPFVIDDLLGVAGNWIPVIVSTLLLAVFAEIIPQWLVPQHAVSWGYYFSGLIWACMWLTGVISYPLAWILDSLATVRREGLGIFTNKQLGIIIKHHDQSEKRGGNLSSEASRIILGVLNNDGRDIGGDIAEIPKSGSEEAGMDIEKGDVCVTRGMIVRWSSVKTVDVNEIVNKAFIEKVTSWSYSRIPVIGKIEQRPSNNRARLLHSWENTQVYGFLHVKHLIGLDFTSLILMPTFVRDLPLYPIPIITEQMPVFEVLHMFQLGMSRMALVVPNTSCLGNSLQGSGTQEAVWTGTQRTHARIASRVEGLRRSAGRIVGHLPLTQLPTNLPVSNKNGIAGIRTPKPIGIITFEDIIDSLLQRTSYDEKDFFEREIDFPPTKSRKAADPRPSLLNIRHHTTIRGSDILLSTVKRNSNSEVLRKRNVSAQIARGGLDGAQEWSSRESLLFDKPKLYSHGSKRSTHDGGSYDLAITKTRGSDNGASTSLDTQSFHGSEQAIIGQLANTLDVENANTAALLTEPDISSQYPEDARPRLTSQVSATLPARRPKTFRVSDSAEVGCVGRNFSAAPRLGRALTTSTFSFQRFPSFETGDDQLPINTLIMNESPNNSYDFDSIASFFVGEDLEFHSLRSDNDSMELSSNISELDLSEVRQFPNKAGDTCSINLRDFKKPLEELGDNPEAHKNNTSVERQETLNTYNGFPPELLNSDKENRNPNYSSKTMPNMIDFRDDTPLNSSSCCDSETRQPSDKSALPIPRKGVNESALKAGNRSSSMWF